MNLYTFRDRTINLWARKLGKKRYKRRLGDRAENDAVNQKNTPFKFIIDIMIVFVLVPTLLTSYCNCRL